MTFPMLKNRETVEILNPANFTHNVPKDSFNPFLQRNFAKTQSLALNHLYCRDVS